MKESYKVEHKEKYHITPQKVWSNVKKWWFVLVLFGGVAVLAMVCYARKDYQNQLAAYETHQATAGTVTENEQTEGFVPATKAELENAYYDLTQLVVLMRPIVKYADSDWLESYEKLGTQWFRILESYNTENVSVSGAQLYQTLSEMKTECQNELIRMKKLPANLLVFRLQFPTEETKEENFTDLYGMARSHLQSILYSSEMQQQFAAGEKGCVLVDEDNWTVQYLVVTNQEQLSVTTQDILSYLEQKLFEQGQLFHVGIAREMNGTLGEFIPNDLDAVQLQINSLAFRTIVPAVAGESVIVAEPVYQFISRGSIIRFGIIICLGGAILFVLILMDCKVRTEEEYYDLFGESPLAVIKGKDKDQRRIQYVEELTVCCKNRNYSTIGILSMGKNAYTEAEQVANLLKEKNELSVRCCPLEKMSELFVSDIIVVVYDTESITEKQLNYVITGFNQVEANLAGMILC